MAADASPYSALGLEPGADAAAIERAYKRLIKQFHPDREGGDPKRAAEINRAYRELRYPVTSALELDEDVGGGRGVSGRVRSVLWLAAAGLLALLVAGAIQRFPAPTAAHALDGSERQEQEAEANAIEQPIAFAELDSAIAEVVRMAATSDELALAEASRQCHHQMHRRPELAQLDRCAAFDDAVVQLQDRDPLRDRGPFSELAVTGRKMSAATLLSNDYLAIDSRLDRIRLHVELALAARRPQAPPPELARTD
jgi:hypothetical protein